MRRIFITGINSFVGKALTKQSLEMGLEVWGVDLQPSCALIPTGQYVSGDLRRLDLKDCIPKDVDAIIHLAALSRDADCKNKGTETFDTNVMGTLKLMDAAQAVACKQFIFASSEWVYGDFKGAEPKSELTPIDASTLKSEYAFSKLVSEINLRQKFNHGFCSTMILRFGIIYGPRESNWSAVESLFNSVKTKDQIEIGSKATARKFIHVEDIASGVLASLGVQGFHVVNLEGDRLVSLGDIISASAEILKKPAPGPKVIETHPASPNIRNVESVFAENVLNWKPKWDLVRGLKSLC